ncbi:MAG: ROK family protein [Miltoncostaeaceae bacterium]
MEVARAIGVDIGGSGIKAAVVDVRTGVLVGERVRVPTPQPSTPDAVLAAAAALVEQLGAGLPVGVGVPGVVLGGVVMSAANIDAEWIGFDVRDALAGRFGVCSVLNDADAAGLAEMRFGAAAGHPGVVLMLTLGTGIGSALFAGGLLVPNTEFGHIEIRGKDGERRASAGARERRGLSYKRWAPLLEEYLRRIDALVWPDLIILGGGVSKRADRFLGLIDVRPPVMPAALLNGAGIVGAAVRAAEQDDGSPGVT